MTDAKQQRAQREVEALRRLMEVHRPTDRCEATTTIMQHHDIRCDLPAGHQGNHHAHVVGHELYLDKDGHTIKARSWQLEWRPQPSAEC